MKQSPQQLAALRTCASCEWIHTGFDGCPKCGFATYGARYVYGNAAYRYKRTQEPWLKKKMQAYEWKMLDEISQANVPAMASADEKTSPKETTL